MSFLAWFTFHQAWRSLSSFWNSESLLSGRVSLLPRAAYLHSNTSERWALLVNVGDSAKGNVWIWEASHGAGSRGGTGVGSPPGIWSYLPSFLTIISFPFTHERCRRLQGGGPTRAWQHSGNTRRGSVVKTLQSWRRSLCTEAVLL